MTTLQWAVLGLVLLVVPFVVFIGMLWLEDVIGHLARREGKR